MIKLIGLLSLLLQVGLALSFTAGGQSIISNHLPQEESLGPPLVLHLTNSKRQRAIPCSEAKAHPLYMETNSCSKELSRRRCIKSALVFGGISLPAFVAHGAVEPVMDSTPHLFKKGKSRIEGYEVLHTKSEWTTLLSGAQYNVLRKGGTERQRGSILEKEKRPGIYACAGCTSPLFTSGSKFDSGTGWPSFDSTIGINAIEIEEMDWMHSSDGAEVRCQSCGGHLGDVFGDGWRFAGSKTGKRYCINGAALLFHPTDGGNELRGDLPPPNKVIQYEPALSRRDL